MTPFQHTALHIAIVLLGSAGWVLLLLFMWVAST
jgi:hypothetical protein